MSRKIVTFIYLVLLIGTGSLLIVEADIEDSKQNLHAFYSLEDGMQWSQRYGYSGDDWGYALISTADGGYALAGTTFNNETKDYDFWLVKTDASGTMQWNQTFGSFEDDWGYAVAQTVDGGYILAGSTYSGVASEWDAWVVKTDANGVYQWDQIYGTPADDEVYTIIQTTDNGFALAGATFDNDTGDYDAWLMKINAIGDSEWEETYGQPGDDWAWAVIETNNEYLFAGSTFNNETDDYDAWLAKFDNNGNLLWDQIYGSFEDDWVYTAIPTVDRGYALAGSTFNNVTENYDFWLVKTDSTGNYQWDHSYGTPEDEEAYAVIQTTDNGFALVGYTDTAGTGIWDGLLVKTDASGGLQWKQSYGEEGDNWAESILQIAGDEFIFIGTATNTESEDYDMWVANVVTPPETTTFTPEMTTSPAEPTTSPPETMTSSPAEITTVPETTTVPELGVIPTLIACVIFAALGVWYKKK
jgi:hypothetical protein